MSNRRLNCAWIFWTSACPDLGGETFRIWQASDKVRPEEERVFAAVGLPACDAAYFCDAEACLYASANALPNTLAPVKTT